MNALYVSVTRAIKNVYLVESNVEHPILGLLGAARALDAAQVEARQSSMEDWQREAGRLEAQGKAEQAEAIREGVLHQTKVPWDVFDRAKWGETAKKALAPQSIHTKAKQQMLDVAAFHDVAPVTARLVKVIAAARTHDEVRSARLSSPIRRRDRSALRRARGGRIRRVRPPQIQLPLRRGAFDRVKTDRAPARAARAR